LSTQVVLDTTIPSEPQHMLDVSAVGVPSGISATPATVDFGKVVKDTTSTAKRIDFSNCSGTKISVTGASISGPDASAFTIVSPAGGGVTSLDDSKSETFLIVMSPHSAGTKTAQLDIANSGAGGTISVPLTGLGAEPQVDRQSYYACSTSRGGASWPIGAAVVAITVGRRRRAKARERTPGYPSAG
jgi:MYXO-CTERM domain-containing protein